MLKLMRIRWVNHKSSLFLHGGSVGTFRKKYFFVYHENQKFHLNAKEFRSSKLYFTLAHINQTKSHRGLCALLGTFGLLLWNYFKGEQHKVNCTEERENETTLTSAIIEARDLTCRLKDEIGLPGISIAVSINGKVVWSEGLGFADLENRVPCSSGTVMRIASISKPITMAIVGKLMEEGKLNIDVPVQRYVPDFPEKWYAGKKVSVTTRMLLSHLGGIRHYEKDCGKKAEKLLQNISKNVAQIKEDASKEEDKEKNSSVAEFENQEYYLTKKFKTIRESLELFLKDELCSEPGSQFLYTTHGWTLISAVAESAAGVKFTKLLKSFIKDLDLQETYLDKNEPLIYHRARYYIKNKNGRIVNAPYVDNSYKWAGGGLLSTVHDLVRFGNAMLYCYQLSPRVASLRNGGKSQMSDTLPTSSLKAPTAVDDTDSASGHCSDAVLPPGYLRQDTMRQIWSPVPNAKASWMGQEGDYAMGWGVMEEKTKCGLGRKQWHYVSHTGGAIGASSVLLVMPLAAAAIGKEGKHELLRAVVPAAEKSRPPPTGVVVAVLTNMQSVGLNSLALQVAHVFRKAVSEKTALTREHAPNCELT